MMFNTKILENLKTLYQQSNKILKNLLQEILKIFKVSEKILKYN